VDIEAARRKVLGMPDQGGGTAHEYLDARAAVVLADERGRLAAAPTRFARALIEAGRTHAEVATAIGVSPSLVGHWATGRRKVPEDRINEVAAYLTMPTWGADSPTSLPLSYFGWLKTYVVAPTGFPADAAIAEVLGVSKARVYDYTYGITDIPEDKATTFVQRFLPGQAAAYGVTT
jgi:DNA-binding transcriptional regulator YdaS (Cro superfamily)